MWGDPHMTTVSNGEPTRKDTNMKLIYILTAILALTLAEEEKKEIKEVVEDDKVEDSEAEASSVELMKEGVDLAVAASAYSYVPPSKRPTQWQSPNHPVQPASPGVQGGPPEVQNDYYWVSTSNPHYHKPTTTTPIPVIKNELYLGDHGDYKYEYQIADGTHVGEQGWFTDPKQTEQSLVKKGWYSYVGADGRTYTVTYWADHTGFHAYGDHLPTPPPAPAPAYPQQIYHDYPSSTQSPKPVNPTKPTYVTTQKPIYTPSKPTYNPPSYVPSQPAYNPTQKPTYNPPQQPAYNPPQHPSYDVPQQPAYNPPKQPAYNPPQQPSYNPPQQPSYNPPQHPSYDIQQTYNPPQVPSYNPPQQPTYNQPQQPTYNQPQQPTYYPNYNV